MTIITPAIPQISKKLLTISSLSRLFSVRARILYSPARSCLGVRLAVLWFLHEI